MNIHLENAPLRVEYAPNRDYISNYEPLIYFYVCVRIRPGGARVVQPLVCHP